MVIINIKLAIKRQWKSGESSLSNCRMSFIILLGQCSNSNKLNIVITIVKFIILINTITKLHQVPNRQHGDSTKYFRMVDGCHAQNTSTSE